MTPNKPTVGFLGLGRMGEPIATNLLAAGYQVTVFDIDNEKCRILKERGAMVAASPMDVAARTDISFAIVMNDKVLREVVLSETGVLAGAAAGHMFCDLSTVSPEISAEIGERSAAIGVRYLRAKVVGSVQRAQDGTLTVLASGSRADFAVVEPIFGAFSDKSAFIGAGEAANFLKLVHSTIVPVYAALIAEALTLGEKGGVEFDSMVDILESGPIGSAQLSLKAPVLKARNFDNPPSDIDTAAKDLDLVLDAARRSAVPMPLTSLVRQMMSYQQAQGDGKKDIWAVLQACEALAGVRTV